MDEGQGKIRIIFFQGSCSKPWPLLYEISRKKTLGKSALFRHCETTPVAPYEAMVVFFGVIGSFDIKLCSWSGLVGAFLQAENGRFVTVMRIANTNYHFRHCETTPGATYELIGGVFGVNRS